MELHELTIHELLDRLRAGETTSAEITASVFGRIDAVEKEVHAYITLMRETALAEAARADERIRKGEIGALTGIPIALKDICCTKGVRTTNRTGLPSGGADPPMGRIAPSLSAWKRNPRAEAAASTAL